MTALAEVLWKGRGWNLLMYNFFEKSESRLVAHTQDVESLSSRSEMVPTQPVLESVLDFAILAQ